MTTLDVAKKRLFTVEELASHDQPTDLWIAVDGKGWDNDQLLHRPYGC
jgi:cytochrome b involved in lipid metabolism